MCALACSRRSADKTKRNSERRDTSGGVKKRRSFGHVWNPTQTSLVHNISAVYYRASFY